MKIPAPPKWPYRLLKKLLHDNQLEILLGDTMEIYYDRVKKKGVRKAKVLYVIDALSLIQPFAFKSLLFENWKPSLSLLNNYRKLAFRGFNKNRSAAAISFIGLVFGFSVAITIALYSHKEMTFDQFHNNYQKIFRVSFQRWMESEQAFNGATTFRAVGPLLKSSFPEVKQQCRLYYPFAPGIINIADQSFHIEKPIFADKEYFNFFSYELIKGKKNTVLKDANKVVLSESLALKYLGSANPIGKVIHFSFEDGSADLMVSGIMADSRNDSHIRPDMLISMATTDQWPGFDNTDWTLPFYHTYVRLNTPHIDSFEKKASGILEEPRSKMRSEGVREFFKLQALTDIQLDSNLTFELEQNGNREAVNFLIIIAFAILIIVYLNNINLSTAMFSNRAREVGIRKVLGSIKSQIIVQFTVETLILHLLAFLTAVILVFAFAQYFGQWLGIEILPGYDIVIISILVITASFGALVFGLIPASIISSIKLDTFLKGNFASGRQGSKLRNFLIGLQFMITIAMVGAMIVLTKQTDYLLSRDPGFDANQILIVHAPMIGQTGPEYLRHIRRFGQEVSALSKVKGFTHSGSVPGKVMGSSSIMRIGSSDDEASLFFNTIDYGYFDTYELEIIAGESFSRDKQHDMGKIILNEAAMHALNFKSPEEAIGSKVGSQGRELTILGISKNYHHSSLKSAYEPIAFLLMPFRSLYMSLNIQTEDLVGTLDLIEGKMKDHFPNNPFEYFFLDKTFYEQFESELIYIKVFRIFSFLAVFLAIMGLFGMSAFVLYQRQKEIGIRKTLGAKSSDIFVFLSSFFLVPCLVGSSVAIILLYVGASEWLNGFPFRIEMPLSAYTLPLLIVFAFSLLTISIQTIKALKLQPAEVLKNE